MERSLTMAYKEESFEKRKSLNTRTNRIRLGLFAFEKNEIDEKRKTIKDNFSFLLALCTEKDKESPKDIKPIIKQISVSSSKTAEDSFDMDEDENSEESSSDLSCEEEDEEI